MKPIPIFLLFVLTLFTALPLFPQTPGVEKQVFTYKTVDGHAVKANIFIPKTEGLHPVVIYFHGGFFFGNRDQGLHSSLREKLPAAGYALVSADYRLAPETKLAGMLQDVQNVTTWLRVNGKREFNIDPDKIVVSGGSAGGYLALTSGFDAKTAPNAIVAISAPTGFTTVTPMGDLSVLNQPGPYDVVQDSTVSYGDYDTRITLWRFLARSGLGNYELFGFDPAVHPEKLPQYTLTDNVTAAYPPVLLIHARYDNLVNLQQAVDFKALLDEKQVVNELVVVDNGHNDELLNQNPQVVDKIIAFINSRFGR
ncbi:MAG TPA: alpha/beta hydrolase [bacterium]|nr:alpha/beta hydrolase [bacterium]HPN42115.1 alpha/beta hydrolase [bacterium]